MEEITRNGTWSRVEVALQDYKIHLIAPLTCRFYGDVIPILT
jgi:hypothetical protein